MGVEALGAVLCGVALGMLLTAAVWVVLKTCGPFNAATRGVVWTATLAALALIPVLYFAGQTKPVVRVEKPVAHVAAVRVVEERAVPASASGDIPVVFVPRRAPLDLMAVYVSIVLLLWARLALAYLRVCLARRRTWPAPVEALERVGQWLERCPTARAFELRFCDYGRSPMAIGFLRPMIVMPADVVLQLKEDEFDDLGVHELAHLRRYDDWVNLFQQMLQAMLFFHPAAYFVGRQINFEREVACDDWVIQAHGGTSYASCLTKIVEMRRWRRGAVLVSGAFFGKRQIMRRVEMLLDKTRDAATHMSGWMIAAIVVAVIGIAAQVVRLPAVVAFTEDSGGPHSTMRWSEGSKDVQVDLRGEMTLTPDERSVATMAPLGYLKIDARDEWSHRRLEVRATAAGAVETKYFFGGREMPMDEPGRAWAAGMYQFLMREQGLDAEGRVARILERKGVAGVLEEVNLIHSDGVKVKYMNLLCESAKLTDDNLRDVALLVKKVGSDGDKAEFLVANEQRFAKDGLRASYFHAVDSIGSDGDRKRVLIHAMEVDGQSAETGTLVARSVKTMGSDGDKAEVLLAVAGNASGAECGLLQSAKAIQSDGDKARVLKDAGSIDTAACREAYFAVVNTIHADGDRAGVLLALLNRPGLGAPVYENIAASAKAMGSDGDKANVLDRLSIYYTAPAFFDAVKEIHSDGDRARVLTVILQRAPSKDAMLAVVDGALGLGAENEKANLLVAVAKATDDKEVLAAVRKACEKLNSDNDYRRVASVLFGQGS